MLESFVAESTHGYVVGRVDLTGKVVEHDTGYRAEFAEAAAVVAVTRDGTLATRDPEVIDALFRHPDDTLQTAELQSFWTHHMISSYLSATGEDPWTSESNVA